MSPNVEKRYMERIVSCSSIRVRHDASHGLTPEHCPFAVCSVTCLLAPPTLLSAALQRKERGINVTVTVLLTASRMPFTYQKLELSFMHTSRMHIRGKLLCRG